MRQVEHNAKPQNQRSVAAARKKEMQLQADQSAQMIEKNKKKVLNALNKNCLGNSVSLACPTEKMPMLKTFAGFS